MVDDPNQPRTVTEAYAGAVSNGSTRVGNDSALRTSGDIVAAAGMNQHRMGLALMRLMSEWQRGATPPPYQPPEIKALAMQAAASRVEEEIDPAVHRVPEKLAMRSTAKVQKSDIDAAHAEQRLLAARATNWNLQENKLRFQHLKTLPAVRAALLDWVHGKGWVQSADEFESAKQLVADTIRHFLSPVCPTCQGRKRKVIQGRAIGADCRPCRGTGEQNLQHGGRGRALLSHMKACAAHAASELREGAYRLRRSGQSDEDRTNHRAHEEVEKLLRADLEAKADSAQDVVAIAQKFRDSMARPDTLRKRKPLP